jgi:penicillin V acylase-like amidase (Ntn superfamily)
MEWGSFDLNGRVIIIPRGHAFKGRTPDGRGGFKWSGKYGVVGTDMLQKEVLADGLNEKGLALGLLYHPGFAVYAAGHDEGAGLRVRESPQGPLNRTGIPPGSRSDGPGAALRGASIADPLNDKRQT